MAANRRSAIWTPESILTCPNTYCTSFLAHENCAREGYVTVPVPITTAGGHLAADYQARPNIYDNTVWSVLSAAHPQQIGCAIEPHTCARSL